MTLRKLAGGVYIDTADDSLHLSLPEILEANGWEDTPENREELAAAALRVYGKLEVDE